MSVTATSDTIAEYGSAQIVHTSNGIRIETYEGRHRDGSIHGLIRNSMARSLRRNGLVPECIGKHRADVAR